MNPKSARKLLAAFISVGCALFLLSNVLGAAQPSRPNVLVIVADDLGWADVGYHNSQIRSPHIDALVAGGVQLDQHYVQPQCTPTRVALLTGRYPSRFGRHCTQASNDQAIPFGTPTMASMLKSLGYETALTGKWHLGSKPVWGPNRFGFDHSYGSLAGAVGMYDHRYRLNRPEFTRTWHRNHEFVEEEGHATDLVAREAVRWIERPRTHSTPFFLYVPLHAVHVPLVEEDEWLKRNDHIASKDRRLFAAAVTHMDHAIGQIVDALKRTGQLENTLIVFTSDNGGLHNHGGNAYPPPDPKLVNFSSNAPLRGLKSRVYEGGIRVPAFVYWKDQLAPRTVSHPLHAVDWMPTLKRLLGAQLDAEPDWDGHDIWPLLTGQQQTAPERTLYWVWGADRRRVALRHGHWKILADGKPKSGRNGTRNFELYDLANDPNETTDLAKIMPEKRAALVRRFAAQAARDAGRGPFQATGFKVGEVADTTAIVWTRLTRWPQRNPAGGPMVTIDYQNDERAAAGDTKRRRVAGVHYPPGLGVGDIRFAAPGAEGETRVLYKTPNTERWQETAWQAVDAKRDYTAQATLADLMPGTTYRVRVEGRAAADAPTGQAIEGQFQTAPARDAAQRVVFTVSTGQMYRDRDGPEGFRIYPSMQALQPSFFVHTGDIVYYDRLAKTAGLARYHWQRTYSLPTNLAFHRHVASYFIKDDHDTWQNDCWPGMQRDNMFEFTLEQGLEIFREQVPMGERTYRTRRWGKDLQVWMVEGRDFRSPNDAPDGPEKTIWGREQMEWLKETVAASDATFRVLISPTPIVGPDRNNKRDNHSNRNFKHEGDQVRQFLAREGLVVVCGDRHWQYMSVDPGSGLREYSCGPASDAHAGGWRDEDYRPDYHRFLKVSGGFLSATVERVAEQPKLTFRFHDVDGKVRHEDPLQTPGG